MDVAADGRHPSLRSIWRPQLNADTLIWNDLASSIQPGLVASLSLPLLRLDDVSESVVEFGAVDG